MATALFQPRRFSWFAALLSAKKGVVVLACSLVLSLLSSSYAKAAGVDYWNQVVKGSNPSSYHDLNDAPTHTGGDCQPTYGGSWFYEHVNSVYTGRYELCDGGSITQKTSGSPGSGATSAVLAQDGRGGNPGARAKVLIPDGIAGGGDTGAARAWSVWTKLDACGTNPLPAVQILGINDPSDTSVYTSDCGHTLTLMYVVNGTHTYHTVAGPGANRWFHIALVWVLSDHGTGTLTWYGGLQGLGQVIHSVTSDIPYDLNGYSSVSFGNVGYPWIHSYPDNGSFSAEWWGFGAWDRADAVALLSPPAGNTGNALTWLGILNAVTPFALTPGTNCVPTPAGPADCGSPVQTPAPISGSVSKYQIGYIPLPVCVQPNSWNPVDWVPYLGCLITYAIDVAINAVIFIANAFIDLVMPDGSGMAGFSTIGSDLMTRVPFVYAAGALSGIATALGGGARSVVLTLPLHLPGATSNFTVDFVALLAPLGQPILYGLSGADLMAGFIWFEVAMGTLTKVRTELGGTQTEIAV